MIRFNLFFTASMITALIGGSAFANGSVPAKAVVTDQNVRNCDLPSFIQTSVLNQLTHLHNKLAKITVENIRESINALSAASKSMFQLHAQLKERIVDPTQMSANLLTDVISRLDALYTQAVLCEVLSVALSELRLTTNEKMYMAQLIEIINTWIKNPLQALEKASVVKNDQFNTLIQRLSNATSFGENVVNIKALEDLRASGMKKNNDD